MNEVNTYASWGSYSVFYNTEKRTFTIKCLDKNNAIYNACIESIIFNGKNIGNTEIFEECEFEGNRCKETDSVFFSIKYFKGPSFLKSLKMKFVVSDNGIKISVNSPENCIVNFSGELEWGDKGCENTYPMSSEKNNYVVRTAIGPASSNKDDMLFDRLSDTALMLKGAKNIRIKYDWENKGYYFTASTGKSSSEKTMHISVKKNILGEQFHIEYAPISRERIFKTPPIGWMTWYAVKFGACEEKVIKNARWMSENLKEYGANCVWVDWEWCHKDMSGSRSDGVDSFNADKEKYPNGLKYVSDKIKEMGLTPALWVGFTVDSAINEYTEKNPEIILVDEVWWCGRYFFDFSHPKYLNEFLPKALSNVPKWGYDVVKFDTLPASMIIHEKHHAKMHNPELTTKEAFRGMVKKARSVLGEKCYMLSCAGDNDADVLWGADIFDSARVGGDIFKWKEFLEFAVKKTLRFYPLHNNVLYADSDNVVLREEFNSLNQAASRIYFVSMLGLPITFGDEFEVLDEARIELIKECLPILDIHPMNIYRQTKINDVVKINLAIEKEWESYNVVNLFNSTEEKKDTEVSLEKDLGLDIDEYIIYDYTKDEFVGIVKDAFNAELEDCESRIFCVRKKTDRPQIISTSRHISQGAAEISGVNWLDSTAELQIIAEMIKKVPYTVTLYVPDGFKAPSDMVYVEKNVYKKTVTSDIGGLTEIKISFGK